jgi:hypothetical protein
VDALRVEPTRREQHAGLGHLLDELPHLDHELLVRRVARGLVVALGHQQESHRSVSFCVFEAP